MNAGDKLIDKESRTEIEIQGNIGKAWIYTIGGTAVYFGTEEIILEKYTPAEPVNEEDEKDQEAIKRLESRGYQITKPGEEFPNNIGAFHKSHEKKLVDLLSEKVQDDWQIISYGLTKSLCPCIKMGMFKVCPHK